MPQALMPDIPYNRYLELARFVSEALQNESEEGRGVPGKRLRQLYLDNYADQNRLEDRAYIEEQKDIIVKTIRYMVHESILKAVPLSEGVVGFVIHPLCKVVQKKDNHSFKKMSDDSYHEESPRRTRSEGEDDEAWGEQLYHDEEEEAERHANAYAEMISGAAPRPTPRRRQRPDTPTRKRRRTEEVAEEIADSTGSSRLDSMSPRQPCKRKSTPEESRRRSAPSRMDALASPNTPRSMSYRGNPSPAVALKIERSTSGSSSWLVEAVDVLRKKHSYDRIAYEKERVICLDCDKSFATSINKTGNRSVCYFESHLRGSGHINTREARLEKQRMNEVTLPAPCQYSTSMAAHLPPAIQCYSLPAIQLGESSSQGEKRSLHGLKSTMIEYFDKVENETTTQTQMIERLGNEATATRVQSERQIEELKKAIEEADLGREEQMRELTQKLTAKNDNQAENVSQVKAQFKEFGKTTNDELNELRASLGFHRKEFYRQTEKAEEQFISQGNLYEQLQNSLNRIASLQSKDQNQFQLLKTQLASLVTADEQHNASIYDLQSKLQFHSDELQAHLKSEEEHRRTTSTQIEAHSKQTEERINGFVIETSEKIRALKSANADQISNVLKETLEQLETTKRENADATKGIREEFTFHINKTNKKIETELHDVRKDMQVVNDENLDSLEKIEALEQANAELEARVEGCNGLLGAMLEGMEEMQKKFEGLAEIVEATRGRKPLGLPKVRKRKTAVRSGRSTSASTSFSSVMS